MTEAKTESLQHRIQALEAELAALRAEAGVDALSLSHNRFDPLRTMQRYRALFNAIDIGFSVLEVLYEDGKPADCRFLEANQAFQDMTGIRNPIGRTANEMLPDENIYWIRLYGRVSETGVPTHQEAPSDSKDRWLDVQAFRLGDAADRQVAIFVNDITARRQSELALRASENRLQQALSAGQGIGTWDWDVESNLVVADERFAKLYGVDPDVAARGTSIAHFFANIYATDLPHAQAVVRGALQNGGPFSAEYRLVQADGSLRWVIATGSCELSPEGKAVRFPGVTFDITDRKEAEARQAALVRLNDRLRDLHAPAEIAYAACEILGQALQVSRIGYGIVDKIAETITIDRDWNAPGVESLAGVLHFRDYGSYIEQFEAGETVLMADVRQDSRAVANADAMERIGVRAFVNMPLIEQGQLVAVFYANHDTVRTWRDEEIEFMREVAVRVRVASARALAEKALRESEEQFRVFAQAVPNQIWAARPDGYLYWFNQQVYAYCDEQPGTLDGVIEWTRIVHPDDLTDAGSTWMRSLKTGQIYETEFRIRRGDGVYRWFLVRAEPVFGADGTIARWVGTNTDIDDRRRQSAELVRLNETLEEKVEARTRDLMQAEEALRQSQKMEAVGQLTGGLAHDFNNLLTGITGSLELLGIRIAQGRFADVERYASAAQSAAKRAASLTHRLLAFSRRQTLDPRPTDVNRLVADIEDMVRRTVGPEIEIEVVAAGGLWPTMVDPNQLENAVLNLCINARDAMPDGGRLTIETANRWLDARAARERDLEPGQYVSLCVSDTGTGMTPDVIAKAFDPFFTTKPLGLGTGLGLSMTYGFARQSGGQVRIYSEVGEGAMICLYLPRHFGPADAAEVAPETGPAPRAEAGETVLVVDDEPTIRMLVAEILEELGYAAIEAADGAGGLAILQSDVRIDLLISDVGLPGGMNGRQMADAARLHRPDLKILFITGYAENAVVGNGHLEPGMHVMTKPFGMEALGARIKGLISDA